MTTATGVPWYHVGRTAGGSNPFESFGLDWCRRCRQVVEADTAAAHRGTTFAFRKRCGRCGRLTSFGAFQNVPLIGAERLPATVLAWITEPGEDRR